MTLRPIPRARCGFANVLVPVRLISFLLSLFFSLFRILHIIYFHLLEADFLPSVLTLSSGKVTSALGASVSPSEIRVIVSASHVAIWIKFNDLDKGLKFPCTK